MIVENKGFENDINTLSDLYEECKDIIQGQVGFNSTPQAGMLLDNIREIRYIAVVNMQANNSINHN